MAELVIVVGVWVGWSSVWTVRCGEVAWSIESLGSNNRISTGSEVLGEENGSVDSVRRFVWYDD